MQPVSKPHAVNQSADCHFCFAALAADTAHALAALFSREGVNHVAKARPSRGQEQRSAPTITARYAAAYLSRS